MSERWAGVLRDEAPALVTGAAGFVGFHVAERLLTAGVSVVGLDCFSDYYDPALKRARAAMLSAYPGFRLLEVDIADRAALDSVFNQSGPRRVIHLAAQAGVRYSIDNPHVYGSANLIGFLNVLEACRRASVAHLVYASSSSVYGGNVALPFSTRDPVDHPVSLYAATKRANEMMAHAYSHLYGLPATGLRFFTVYGPWGRPDMAYWKFAEAIEAGRPIEVYNHGDMGRDFTYIDDIVEALLRLTPLAPKPDPCFDREAPDPASSWAPHRIYNIGATQPERLMTLIALLEEAIGRKAVVTLKPMQPGDVKETWADVSDLERLVDFRPQIGLREGLQRFVAWRREWLDGRGAARLEGASGCA